MTARPGIGISNATFPWQFSLIEITALFVAFLYNLIHANDYETLVLSGNDLKIERKIGLQTHQVLWVRSLTRIEPRVHANELIQFRQGQESMSFGKFIHANSRPLLSQEIAARLFLAQLCSGICVHDPNCRIGRAAPTSP
ncbi:MAG: DUF2244 domain-containing protein [Betaproteobacteria bacterium]|nr:DUF2244 domain-containing protein [Betaproteobacteria bacterium]